MIQHEEHGQNLPDQAVNIERCTVTEGLTHPNNLTVWQLVRRFGLWNLLLRSGVERHIAELFLDLSNHLFAKCLSAINPKKNGLFHQRMCPGAAHPPFGRHFEVT